MGVDADAENNFININGMWHATLSVSMGPQQLLTFAQLKARIPAPCRTVFAWTSCRED
ncbi:hypothetical protein OVX87_32030 [Klebsiella pneumoniae]|nr:hypothetical protein [Klebsiella pneumoniae]MCY0629523.1 hypothetical protein [Klebsiella pneumoniae]